ncbi:hypothetical protein NMG60_11000457 [Bertholletia excelsa]
MTIKTTNFLPFFEPRRDAYGFTVRPQHLQRYREYLNIYKEEEEERSEKWKRFLDQQESSAQSSLPDENDNRLDAEVTEQQTEESHKNLHAEVKEQNTKERSDSTLNTEVTEEESNQKLHTEATEQNTKERSNSKVHTEVIEQKAELGQKLTGEADAWSGGTKSDCDSQTESRHDKEAQEARRTKSRKVVQTWGQIRPSLQAVEKMLSSRVERRKKKKEQMTTAQTDLSSIEGGRSLSGESEVTDDSRKAPAEDSDAGEGVSSEPLFRLKQELEFLVHGGVPRDLRGEVWQAFVGVRTRRVDKYYQNLLVPECNGGHTLEDDGSGNGSKGPKADSIGVPEKWRRQIEKDLPRTFPGHPALDEHGRSSLRRILLAYAQHNPSVGYCQAMNFFAGILLLMMPEENAFWTLVGILDDYFDGYYSEEMIESQVDQLVFEELTRERFPKLVNHLDYLGVQVAWFSGPWFLSIFVNALPWESVLRIWDVLLFEGNRVMLFRTALALMELYGPALVTTRDAGDAITLLQSLSGSTFDSSQLVLTACMGFLAVTEDRLQQLREKHRPVVLAAVEERLKGKISKESKSLATKLYSFKKEKNEKPESGDKLIVGDADSLKSQSTDLDDFLSKLTDNYELDSVPDLQEQVVWLKVELCRLLEEKRSAMLRAEELETALMELVKEDNRRELSARVEQLEQEVAELRQTLIDKKEQENAMVQVLMRVEQEQKVTEDARIFAEQDAAAQRIVVQMLQEKYDKAMASLGQMEKRVVMAETMLEATIQYEHGQGRSVNSPRASRADCPGNAPSRRTGLLSFGLGWRDRSKGKQTNVEEPNQSKSTCEETSTGISNESNGNQGQEK